LYADLAYSESIEVIKTSPPDLVSNIGGTMGNEIKKKNF
jgi:hypothetical protein